MRCPPSLPFKPFRKNSKLFNITGKNGETEFSGEMRYQTKLNINDTAHVELEFENVGVLAGSVIYVEKKSCIRCASVLQTNTSTSFSPAFTASVISQRYGRNTRECGGHFLQATVHGHTPIFHFKGQRKAERAV